MDTQQDFPMSALFSQCPGSPRSPSSINTIDLDSQKPSDTSAGTAENYAASPTAEAVFSDCHTELNEVKGTNMQDRDSSTEHDKDEKRKGNLKHSHALAHLKESDPEHLNQPLPDCVHSNKSGRRFPVNLKPLEIPAPLISTTLSPPSTQHGTPPREDSLSEVDINYRDTLFDLLQYDSDVSSPGGSVWREAVKQGADYMMRPDSPTQGQYMDVGVANSAQMASDMVAKGRRKHNKYDIESESESDTENGTEVESPPAPPRKSSLRNLKAYAAIAEASRQQTSHANVILAGAKVQPQGTPAVPLKSPLRNARLYTRIAEASRRRHDLEERNAASDPLNPALRSLIRNPSISQGSSLSPTSVRGIRGGNGSPDSPLARTLQDRRRGGGNNDHMDAYHSFLWDRRKPRSPSSPKQFINTPAPKDQQLIPLSSISHWASLVGSSTGNGLFHAGYTAIPLRGGGTGYEFEDSSSHSLSPASSLRSSRRATRGPHLRPQQPPNTVNDDIRREGTGLAGNIPRVAEYAANLRNSQFLDPEVASTRCDDAKSIFSTGESTFPSSAGGMYPEHEDEVHQRGMHYETPPTTKTPKQLFLKEAVVIKKWDAIQRGNVHMDKTLSEEQKIEKIKEIETRTNRDFLKARDKSGYNDLDDETAIRVAWREGSSSEPSTAQQTQPPSLRARPAHSATHPIPREERWIPATLSKAGKVLWKGVKVVLAVPTEEELKSFSRLHPPPGHVPMQIPMGTGSVAPTPWLTRTREERSLRQWSRQRSRSSNGYSDSVRSMRTVLSGAPPAGSSAGGTTWPRLNREDYGSQL